MDNGSCCPLEGTPVSLAMPPLLILAFVLGALGNGAALCGFCFHLKTWKASTIYLFNLAVADLLLLLCLPWRADYYLRGQRWAFEDAACRLLLFLLAASRAGSIAFLTAVAVDRYLRVLHPHRAASALSRRRAAAAACALWGLAALGAAPLLTRSHLCARRGGAACESFAMEAARGWHDALFQAEFFLPLAVLGFCSGRVLWRLRRRPALRRARRLVAAVAAVFVAGYLPSALARLYFLCTEASSACHPAVHAALHLSLGLTYLGSALDPLLYCFSSPSFPRFYRRLAICGRGPGRPAHPTAEGRGRVLPAGPEIPLPSPSGPEIRPATPRGT
ncbi:hydroxycarboxylic acid receptor 1 [Thomomys bottae]